MNRSKIDELTKKLNEQRALLIEESKKVLLEACTEIFEKHPKVENFSWVQYTDYFNDGRAILGYIVIQTILYKLMGKLQKIYLNINMTISGIGLALNNSEILLMTNGKW